MDKQEEPMRDLLVLPTNMAAMMLHENHPYNMTMIIHFTMIRGVVIHFPEEHGS